MNHHRDIPAIERTIQRLEQALQEARAPQWINTLSPRGYDYDKILSGIKFVEEIRNLIRSVHEEFSEQVSELTEITKAERTAKSSFFVIRKIAEIAFDDMPAAQIALHLTNNSGEWKTDAQNFYKSLLKNRALANRMNSYGYRLIHIKEESKRINDILCPRKEYPSLSPTSELQNEMKELYSWMTDFISVLKSVRANSPVFTELYREICEEVAA